MRYIEGQEFPVTINSIFDQRKQISTKVIVRKIVDGIIFVHIPMENNTYQNLFGTAEQLDSFLEKRGHLIGRKTER